MKPFEKVVIPHRTRSTSAAATPTARLTRLHARRESITLGGWMTKGGSRTRPPTSTALFCPLPLLGQGIQTTAISN